MVNRYDDVIIGAGPAGLTAAFELSLKGRSVLVLEVETQVGGISKTINHNGNRMDLGGHRFFSKSDWVMNWWSAILPLSREAFQGSVDGTSITYQNSRKNVSRESVTLAESDSDEVLLLRPRLSRIYYLRSFFDYPVKMNVNTIRNLGLWRIVSIGVSYIKSRIFPINPERTLEEFLINRFGTRLYTTFFKDYTEKVWGVPCSEISAEWGAQRIKGLSIVSALRHAVQRLIRSPLTIEQKKTETSLIEQFLYPKFGPGQMWEKVTEIVTERGVDIKTRYLVTGVKHEADGTYRVVAKAIESGVIAEFTCNNVISTMPISALVQALQPPPPTEVQQIANSLPYRAFMTVGLLVSKMSVDGYENGMPSDNWIYIQEPEVKIGRLQIFNNWSPEMVGSRPSIWLGLEYFCDEGDHLWGMADADFIRFAADELASIGLIDAQDVLDAVVVRVPKAYPAYFGAYSQLDIVKDYLRTHSNLYLVGRNGMHRYNNQDHSMLSAKYAVDCILGVEENKEGIWSINVEQDYHEAKSE
jgi:protoporphyrinogen oxidase